MEIEKNERTLSDKNPENQTAERQLENQDKQNEVDRRLKKHGYTGSPRTPSTDDPTAVLSPDDTFPGSGPTEPGDR